MLYVNLVINNDFSEPANNEVQLFRINASDLIYSARDNIFTQVMKFQHVFALHLILDNLLSRPAEFEKLLYRLYLLVGKENYARASGYKQLFISTANRETPDFARFRFRLKLQLASGIRITSIPGDRISGFHSTDHVFYAEDKALALDCHFANFLQKNSPEELFTGPEELAYTIISDTPIDLNYLDTLLSHRLLAIPNILATLNNLSLRVNSQREIIAYSRKEITALLHTVSYLKKEAKTNLAQKEKGLSHILHIEKKNKELERRNLLSNKTSNDVETEINMLQQIREIREKYQKEYEALPPLYKKFGTVLKIITGRKEFSYYLSSQQKKAFMDTIYALPKEKQLSTWYYYEYEILPDWYKRVGKIFNKNK